MIRANTIRIAALAASALLLALVALLPAQAQAQSAFFGFPPFPGPTDKQNWFGMFRAPEAQPQNVPQRQNTRQRGKQRDTHMRSHYASSVARHAATHGVPPELVHRVIMRESRYNPRAVSMGNYGMMQIRLGTARAMGYQGSAAGLLDPDTNMAYAVRYLAGAYRVAGGNHDRAVGLYARGYYYEAKRQGFSPYGTGGMQLASASSGATSVAPAIASPEARAAYASAGDDAAATPLGDPRDAAINVQLVRDAVPQ